MEKIDAYVAEALPFIESFIGQDSGDDKWLMGTDELTMLDIHAGAFLDSMYTAFKAEANSEGAARANLAVNAPIWTAYMERLRAHPKIAPVCINQEA